MKTTRYDTLVGEGCPTPDIQKCAENRNNYSTHVAASCSNQQEQDGNMQIKEHTIGTANEKIVPPTFWGSRRPKVWLRRAPANLHHAIREYILNKRTQAAGVSLANLKRLMGQ